MKIFFCIVSLLCLHSILAFKVASSGREIPEIPPEKVRLRVNEVKSKKFQLDPYCGGYDAFGLCSMCYDSFLDVANKKCAPVKTLIPNCWSYTQDEMCLVCKFGFRIVGQGERCRPNRDPNCLVENSRECEVSFPLIWIILRRI